MPFPDLDCTLISSLRGGGGVQQTASTCPVKREMAWEGSMLYCSFGQNFQAFCIGQFSFSCRRQRLNWPRSLLTRDSENRYLRNITIPAGFIKRTDGDVLKDLMKKNVVSPNPVYLTMDWKDILPRHEKVTSNP